MKGKKVSLILCVCAATLLLPGCGNAQKRETNTDKKQDFGTTADKIEISADELLDSFIDGEVMAYYVRADSPFYITDLPSDPEDFTCYSVGDRVDLDNDGENELILKGPYGGKYLDARDGQVYTYGDKRITREEYDELKLKMLGE